MFAQVHGGGGYDSDFSDDDGQQEDPERALKRYDFTTLDLLSLYFSCIQIRGVVSVLSKVCLTVQEIKV